jgi:hypothetical protein
MVMNKETKAFKEEMKDIIKRYGESIDELEADGMSEEIIDLIKEYIYDILADINDLEKVEEVGKNVWVYKGSKHPMFTLTRTGFCRLFMPFGDGDIKIKGWLGECDE